ncbi:MAG: FecR domain-containing protein [Acidobacteriaceae bacterium]|nr:FecR domain-containing protein [Acidobacteriaceae bacterium]
MNRNSLDEIIAEIRREHVEDEVVSAAAKRVFRNLFDSAFLADRREPVRIRDCSDFESLIPAYLAHTLTPSRVALLEDHTRQCVECRRALAQARMGEDVRSRPAARPLVQPQKRRPALVWALAASLAIGIGIGITGAMNGLLPGQHAVRATVMSVEGTLYRVSDVGSSLVEAGAMITNSEELRTAKGSRAILRLLNGAQIEMAERSDVSVSGGWRGTAVQLDRGHVIVQAIEPGQKVFFVAAGDLLIPVRNAVLSVNRGTKGSRVAVAKGSAQIESSQKTFDLAAGQQFNSDYRVRAVPISTEFAWSKNADYYLSLLNELSTLQKQLESIPSPGLRYSSNLAKYLPENTVVYAAIPNLGGPITEAKRIFDQRLAESDVLREWWQRQPASRNGELDRTLSQISSISQYLGDEIVMTVGATAPDQHGDPVLLAEIRQPGLREYLQQNMPAGAELRIIDSRTAAAPAPGGSLFVSLDNNVVVASPDLAQLRQVAQTGSTSFPQTPFFGRISQAYRNGVGYLLAIDMEQMVAKSVNTPKEVPAGFSNVQYLVLERREATGKKTESRAALSFAGAREGVASWLGAPGPMGSLDFVSPDAAFAASFVMKDPRTVMQELITFASQGNANASQELTRIQEQLGVNLAEDVAAPLGGDATFAIDGPALPLPAWKLAIEVYDPAHLQNTIATLVDHFNQHPSSNSGKLQLSSEQVNSRTFYSLRSEKLPDVAAYYTFVDGYLVAAQSKANLVQAIQNRQTGYTLVSSAAFRNELPDDGHTNFSAIVYHNAGSSIGPIASQLKSSAQLSQAQQQALSAVLANTAPGLICIYGEPDRIVAATKDSFLGFNLGTLAGIEQGRPLVPLIASSATNCLRPDAAGRASQRSQ